MKNRAAVLSAFVTTAALIAGLAADRSALHAQTAASEDAILARILERGRDQAQAKKDAHHLFDVIGPRLTASPGDLTAHDWLLATYKQMGLEAWNEAHSKYRGWRRGATHADLLSPRARTLEAIAMAWSPGTPGSAPVEASVVVLPSFNNPQDFEKWLPTVRGAFVMASAPDSTCRTVENWKAFAKADAVERMQADRKKTYTDWLAGFEKMGVSTEDFPKRIEAAGGAGLLVKNWWKQYASAEPLDGWGVSVVMDANTEHVPMVNLSCEDYGLLWRLAENGDHPRVRVSVDAEFMGDSPVENTVARIPGTELPNETIVLTAHLDSWDAGSGATDNGTGTLKMLGAMRILHDLYPRPRRTILVRHWSGEEEALSTTRNVMADMTKIAEGVQLVMNQDVGTGRATALFAQGMPGMHDVLERFLKRVPPEIGAGITVEGPRAGSFSSDAGCIGFPVVNLWPMDKATKGYTWSYDPYTWHTNRDTYDKVIFDDVQFDSTLVAMLAYLASEAPDPSPVGSTRVASAKGDQSALPPCADMHRLAMEKFQADQAAKKKKS